MSIYLDFKPTYLYIKQHSITGKLYFGKTIKNPETYMGSGKHWVNHIKFHGKEFVETLWYCIFFNQEDCTKFALTFSEQQNIVENSTWLNKKPENGLDGGGHIGHKHTVETKRLMSDIRTGDKNYNFGKCASQETKLKMSLTRKDNPKYKIPKSEETKDKISKSLTGYIPTNIAKENLSKAMVGRRWYNDETRNYFIYPTDNIIKELQLSVGCFKK